jgi:glycosyltransferase involved in cell wall biosynthesis
LREEGVNIVQLAAPADVLQSVADIRAYSRAAVRESTRGYDVIHAELGGGSLREFYALRSVQRHTTLLTGATLHDPPHPVWWPFHVHAVRQRRLLGGMLRRVTSSPAHSLQVSAVRRCDAVLALTDAGLKAIAEAYGPGLPLHLLQYPLSGHPVAERAKDPSDKLTIGFFGYWYSGKGLTLLADALAQLALRGVPFRALLWGDISRQAGVRPGQRYREDVLAHLRAGGLAEHVEVLGYLDPDEVAVQLHECDVVVLPYQMSSATAGLKSTSAAMFDALAAGTPVIASDVKALDEQIRHEHNGLLIPPGDVEALSTALARVYRDQALRTRLRDGARATARSMDPQAAARSAISAYSQPARDREHSHPRN